MQFSTSSGAKMTPEDHPRRDSLEDASELASLLPDSPERRHRRYRDNLSISSISSIASSISSLYTSPPRKSNVANILYFIIFISCYSGGFFELSLTRLIEDLICHEYYNVKSLTEPIDESLCKEDAIQKHLAYLLAVTSVLYSIVGFVAAFPWGLAADKIGRKPIVAVAMTGGLVGALMELAVVYWSDVFPITAIWASSAGQLIGGGNGVLIAVVLSMIADTTNEEDRFVHTLIEPILTLRRLAKLLCTWLGPLHSCAYTLRLSAETCSHRCSRVS
ncbi:hypothetical protein NUW58_g10580 [Xylaria curta]|uniref:Uncharacterized protein n=1 Tax=Xylaria curta TaxID=42375 RepID=A0ACC1MKE3_9PEZI|nr:hypothetical protein NUW58_g10580 [Xylaria curta]